MTQAEMAEALGMTQTYVSMMERGDAPIERRTELAAFNILNNAAPMYDNRELDEQDGDVPLEHAMVLWDPLEPAPAPVVVVAHPNEDDDVYSASAGACTMPWPVLDTTGRLLRLFGLFQQLTVYYKIPPADVHRAFLCIPEYRRSVIIGTLPDELRPEHLR